MSHRHHAIYRDANATRFGEELRTQRRAARLSQSALGRLAAVHVSEINRFESGERTPQLFTAVKLAVALAGDEEARCRLLLSAGYVPPGYVVTGLRREARSTRKGEAA